MYELRVSKKNYEYMVHIMGKCAFGYKRSVKAQISLHPLTESLDTIECISGE